MVDCPLNFVVGWCGFVARTCRELRRMKTRRITQKDGVVLSSFSFSSCPETSGSRSVLFPALVVLALSHIEVSSVEWELAENRRRISWFFSRRTRRITQ